jgi:heptaprenyl diphosphate synthase
VLADAFQQQVSQRLRQLVGDVPAQLRGPITMLVDAPGKRLRSGLVHACARFGHEAEARVVRTGCVVELLHIASLLHDDVVDGAATRRGAPAVHLLIGAESALLGGLACFALVGVEAAALGEATSRAVSVTTAELAYGQMLDLERAFDTTLAMSDYLELVARKTADLFRLCCMLGAAESGADAGEVASLGRFGVELGIAFQILDDCLEIEATDSGKPMGTDHLRGLFGAPTLLALHADATGTLTELR